MFKLLNGSDEIYGKNNDYEYAESFGEKLKDFVINFTLKAS